MSKKRQPEPSLLCPIEEAYPVRTYAVRYPSGFVSPAHAHDWHQLIHGSHGVMTVVT